MELIYLAFSKALSQFGFSNIVYPELQIIRVSAGYFMTASQPFFQQYIPL